MGLGYADRFLETETREDDTTTKIQVKCPKCGVAPIPATRYSDGVIYVDRHSNRDPKTKGLNCRGSCLQVDEDAVVSVMNGVEAAVAA